MSRLETPNGATGDNGGGTSSLSPMKPSKGVAVEGNGAVGPEIKGSDFATTLPSVWIVTTPPNEELRTGPLGDKCY